MSAAHSMISFAVSILLLGFFFLPNDLFCSCIAAFYGAHQQNTRRTVAVQRVFWHAWRDSNPHSSPPEGDVLSITLQAHILFLPGKG